MEGLGGAASVIAVVQISGKVLSLCWKYCADAKDAKPNIESLRDEILAVQDVLERTRALIEGSGANKLVARKACIARCSPKLQEEFERLETILDLGKRRKAMHRIGLRALKWLLKKEYVNETLQFLERHKTTLLTALNTDEMCGPDPSLLLNIVF